MIRWWLRPDVLGYNAAVSFVSFKDSVPRTATTIMPLAPAAQGSLPDALSGSKRTSAWEQRPPSPEDGFGFQGTKAEVPAGHHEVFWNALNVDHMN